MYIYEFIDRNRHKVPDAVIEMADSPHARLCRNAEKWWYVDDQINDGAGDNNARFDNP